MVSSQIMHLLCLWNQAHSNRYFVCNSAQTSDIDLFSIMFGPSIDGIQMEPKEDTIAMVMIMLCLMFILYVAVNLLFGV